MIVHTTAHFDEIATLIADKITASLVPEEHGLWLLSGGSCIALEVAVSNLLPHMKGLTVMLVDERFGPVGHQDSNWALLKEAGFAFDKFTSLPTLVDEAEPIHTVTFSQKILQAALDISHYTIAVFGMGPDGHIAGLLPHSEAIHSNDIYTDYSAPPLHRLTITPRVFPRIDYGLVFTRGAAKLKLLDRFDASEDADELPVRLVAQCKHFDIYNVAEES